MRTLLITGGAGFMGSHFAHHWATKHPADRIVVLDALTYAGNRESIAVLERANRIQFMHADVCDRAAVHTVMREHDIDTIVHFAAESHVDRSIASAETFVRTNVLGTQVLLDAARESWRTNGMWRVGARFHQISTDEVYGELGENDAPFTEESPYRPSSPYAASKAAADHFVRAAGRTHGFPFSISHCANNYGPHQYPEKLIPLMLASSLAGRTLPVYGNGLQMREWIYVTDHSAAVERILLADVVGESFNIGSGRECTNLDLVRLLCAQLDARFEADPSLAERFPECPAASGRPCSSAIAHVADRAGHDRRYAMSVKKARRVLRFEAQVPLEQGLAATIDWVLTR